MATAPTARTSRDRAGWLCEDAERTSGDLPALRRLVRDGWARGTTAAALLLVPVLALAEPPALSSGPGVTADDAVWLFDAVCLVNHPDFRESGAVLDEYDFPDLETALPRQHPEKMLQAVVLPLPPDATGARSCTVMAAGIGFAEVDAKLEPLIAGRLDQMERHHDAEITLPHAVWVNRTQSLQTKIILAEHEGASVIAASVTPLQEQGQ